MRVAYVCADPGVPVFGAKGCSVHVQEVMRALLRRGAAVDLFATRMGGNPPGDLQQVQTHRLGPPKSRGVAARERELFALNGPLRQLLQRQPPFDLVYERQSLWSCAAMEWASETNTPSLLEVNAALIEEQANYRELADREGADRAARRTFAAAGALIAVSENVADYLRGLPHTNGRVYVVPNAVRPDRFPLRNPQGRPNDAPFTVGFLGTLKPWHGLDVLFEAFGMLDPRRPARLLIVGDGPLRRPLAGQRPEAEFTGSVRPDEVPAHLSRMDVGVAPYPELPNFYFSPLKIYEYMAANLPVAASRLPGVTDVIQHGQNGLLVRPGDPHALVKALARLRDDKDLRRRLGKAARQTVVHHHTWDQAVHRMLQFVEPMGIQCGRTV